MTTPKLPLGAFSVSLAVKDFDASRAFYEKLGFALFAGNPARKWALFKSGNATIGLFQGMFERNILTFNPGWDADGKPVEGYTDVRALQQHVRALGIEPVTAADESTTGPASFVIVDPDGNPILVDQHV